MNTETTSNIGHYRDLLIQRRQNLAQQLAVIAEEVKIPSGDEMYHPQPADQVDLGTENADTTRLFATARLEQQQLEAIEAAIGRIDHGSYGTCEECGVSISDRRLELVPETTMCTECKRAAEFETSSRRKGP